MFSGFINDIKCSTHTTEAADGEEEVSSVDFNFLSKEKRNAYKGKVLENIEKMDDGLVFKLYYQLAFTLKKRLGENEIEPDLI